MRVGYSIHIDNSVHWSWQWSYGLRAAAMGLVATNRVQTLVGPPVLSLTASRSSTLHTARRCLGIHGWSSEAVQGVRGRCSFLLLRALYR